MLKIVAIADCSRSSAHEIMAVNAIKKIAEDMGHTVKVKTLSYKGSGFAITEEDIKDADIIITAIDTNIDMKSYNNKIIYSTTISSAIMDTKGVINSAVDLLNKLSQGRNTNVSMDKQQLSQGPDFLDSTESTEKEKVSVITAKSKKYEHYEDAEEDSEKEKIHIVAVTSCPTGIAHTFMAAESLKQAAEKMGYDINIETQGSVGTKNILSDEEIERADLVIIAADTAVDMKRFVDKLVFTTSANKVINSPNKIIEEAFLSAKQYIQPIYTEYAEISKRKKGIKKDVTGFYKHLLTGVSFMLPIVVAGGLCIALSFIFGINAFKEEGSIANVLMEIGSGAAFKLMIPVLSGYIAFSISDRPGIAPGLIGGMLADSLGAGFIGGIASGFIAGYSSLFFKEKVKLPETLEGIKPVLVIPLMATLITGFLMIYVIGKPVGIIMEGLTEWLNGLTTTNAIFLGMILGFMMAFDMGGPVNKSAYTFSVGLLASGSFVPMAAVMAAGMTPPLGLSIATLIYKNKFTKEETAAGKAAGVLGLCFITEGAIPFAAKDPFRVIPSIMIGSAVTGALSVYFGCGLRSPHGGIFAIAIPQAVINLPQYLMAIVAGVIVTTLALYVTKRNIR